MLLRYTNAIPQNYKALQRPPKKLYVKFPHLKMKNLFLSLHELAGIAQSIQEVATGWTVGDRIQARRNFLGVKRWRREANNELPPVPEFNE